ncbi:MAG: hypothetical protein HXS44_02780 [Theionarchaea archaeon]|nr:hypothetical protein [Theionarchaea archaeon]
MNEDGGNNEETKKKYLSELFSFACVLRGEVKHLEEIKEYIITEYVNKGHVKLIRPTYEKSEIYLLTSEEWKEYQKLKKRDERLIGAGFP